MTLTDHQTDRAIERPDLRAQLARLEARQPQCECPDFCPVQHDNDN